MDISYLKPRQLRFALRTQDSPEIPMFDLFQYCIPNDTTQLLSFRNEDKSHDILVADKTLDFSNTNGSIFEQDYDNSMKYNWEDSSDVTLLNSTISSNDLIITSPQNSIQYLTIQQSPYNYPNHGVKTCFMETSSQIKDDLTPVRETSHQSQTILVLSNPSISLQSEQQTNFKRKIDDIEELPCKKQKLNDFYNFISSEGPEIIFMESERDSSPQPALETEIKFLPSFPYYSSNGISQMIQSSFDPIFYSDE